MPQGRWLELNEQLTDMKIKIFFLIALVTLLGGTASCSSGHKDTDIDSALQLAQQDFADGYFESAQKQCNDLFGMLYTPDSVYVSEQQAARLGILLMMLSENINSDENIAEATLCIRYAYRHSADSLHSFATGLSLDEARHYELLRRIGLSLDNPVDLDGEETENPEF